jgi:hypothetical protein
VSSGVTGRGGEAYPRRTDPVTKRTPRIMICIMSAALNTTLQGRGVVMYVKCVLNE